MLKNLRLRLTLLYLLFAMLLVILLGGSTYSVLYFYFQNANDSALRTKLVLVLDSLGTKIPSDLVDDHSYEYESGIEVNEDDHEDEEIQHVEELYEGELSSIFILPLNDSGELLFNPNPYSLPMQPDLDAINSAAVNGIDYRNVNLDNGAPARLLTYSVSTEAGIKFIQMGKSIVDQTRILNQFLTSLLTIGAISIIILGAGSWWVAGRTLANHQLAWENQQAFIANASHELRTPLTLIRASAEAAIRGSKENDKIQSLLEDVISETDHMCNLVEDLLLLTRLDAGQMKLSLSKISVSDLTGNIERQFERLAENLSIRFQVKSINLLIQSDYTRLRQVLLILLDNAFRHTPSGGNVYLSVSKEGQFVHFLVRDTGEGIPPTHLPFVFDRFYQVESDRGGENHGAGLGLPIAKSLVEVLGGKIEIQSESGKGTDVEFKLPLDGQ